MDESMEKVKCSPTADIYVWKSQPYTLHNMRLPNHVYPATMLGDNSSTLTRDVDTVDKVGYKDIA